MDSYPSNSRATSEEPPAEKKIESVVTGEVTRRKKPWGKRLSETLVGGDISDVSSYVVLQVLVPAAKDMISDALSQAVDRMLFGDSTSRTRSRSSSRPSGTNGYVSYNRMSQGRSAEPRSGLNEFARRPRSSHDFDEIVVATRVEGEEVLNRMSDIIDQYEQATVADLLELVGISGNHVDHKWGWTDVSSFRLQKIRDGYLIDHAKPESFR